MNRLAAYRVHNVDKWDIELTFSENITFIILLIFNYHKSTYIIFIL